MDPVTILLVTWFKAGQPPASYQLEVNSPTTCDAVATRLKNEAAKLNEEHAAKIQLEQEALRSANPPLPLAMPSGPVYAISAVCVIK